MPSTKFLDNLAPAFYFAYRNSSSESETGRFEIVDLIADNGLDWGVRYDCDVITHHSLDGREVHE